MHALFACPELELGCRGVLPDACRKRMNGVFCTLWQSEWLETDWSKSDNNAFATKGQKLTSLTTINIHFLRPHEPRRAEHAHKGARRGLVQA